MLDGSLELDHLDDLPDEEVIEQLVAVKGIGLWSAQMFLIIHLRRPDVLPVGDLGIRKAIMTLYGLPALPGPAEVIEIGEPWRPYRTLACLYLWRSLHTSARAERGVRTRGYLVHKTWQHKRPRGGSCRQGAQQTAYAWRDAPGTTRSPTV